MLDKYVIMLLIVSMGIELSTAMMIAREFKIMVIYFMDNSIFKLENLETE